MSLRGLLDWLLWLTIVAAIAAAFAFTWPPFANAHEVGCDGKPPSAVIKQSCCGDHDWLRLEPGQWRQDGSIYSVMLDGKWEPVVERDNVPIEPLPSTDGCDYVWFRRQQSDAYWHDDETAHMGAGTIHFFCLQLSMSF